MKSQLKEEAQVGIVSQKKIGKNGESIDVGGTLYLRTEVLEYRRVALTVEREVFARTSRSEQITVLLLFPKTWSLSKVWKEFLTTLNTARDV